ncbi:hypothetical protein D3C75_830790 [compost metagenome]
MAISFRTRAMLRPRYSLSTQVYSWYMDKEASFHSSCTIPTGRSPWQASRISSGAAPSASRVHLCHHSYMGVCPVKPGISGWVCRQRAYKLRSAASPGSSFSVQKRMSSCSSSRRFTSEDGPSYAATSSLDSNVLRVTAYPRFWAKATAWLSSSRTDSFRRDAPTCSAHSSAAA